MESTRDRLVGNRLALAGTILYLLEWVGIVLAPSLPTDRVGVDATATLSAYADRPAATAFLAGWLALVLPGRILFTAGLRASLRTSPRQLPLATWAVGAMTVSVAVEVACYAVVSGGAWAAHNGAEAGVVAALDSVATMLFNVVVTMIGVSMFAGGLAMLLSRLFPSWLSWVGVVGGVLIACGGPLATAAAGATGSLGDVAGAVQVLLFAFWVWIIGTSLVLFRRTPNPAASTGSRGEDASQTGTIVV